jgi:hypothetical protein
MKDAAIRTVQPVVVPAQVYTCGTVAGGFIAIFPAFFAGIITMDITNQSGPSVAFGFLVYLVVLVAIMVLIGWNAYAGPDVTRYQIYRDRIEVESASA